MREDLREELRRVALFTSGIAEMTRNRAEDLVRDWVRSDVRREQAQAMAKDLLEWSKHNRKELTAFVRAEIQTQLTNIGVVPRRDFDRLERRVATLEDSVRSLAASSARRDTPSRKATAGASIRGLRRRPRRDDGRPWIPRRGPQPRLNRHDE